METPKKSFGRVLNIVAHGYHGYRVWVLQTYQPVRGKLVMLKPVCSLVMALLLIISVRGDLVAQADAKPFRVVIAGLTHGHVAGFLDAASKRTDIEIVGIAEPDQPLARRYSIQFELNSNLFYTDLDHMLEAVKPQAVLAYTDTSEHRRVVETAASHHVPVMMEKPLA